MERLNGRQQSPPQPPSRSNCTADSTSARAAMADRKAAVRSMPWPRTAIIADEMRVAWESPANYCKQRSRARSG
jgi:hypothetical protein